MAYKQNIGKAGEVLAADMLTAKGYRVIEKNYFCADGEIDIIAMRKSILCFIEVKTRTSDTFGAPAEAIDRRKQQAMRKAAACYIAEKRPQCQFYEFQAVEVMINHITDLEA